MKFACLVCGLFGALVNLVGCGGDDGPMGTDEDTSTTNPAATNVTTSCVPGEKRECKETIATVDGVTWCVKGTSTCGDDARWGACKGGDAGK